MNLLFVLFAFFTFAQDQEPPAVETDACTLSIEIRDAIGPATFDYMERAVKKASEKNCVSLLAKINTPGGSLQSTRKIVELIMSSPIPFLCLVHPSGGHAGSAGAIIMQACHINGAMEATNIGAASPVAGTGQEIPEDMRKKLFEDTRSWVEGLAKYRGRSVEFAREIVLDAKALDAKEALKVGAIDMVATSEMDFLKYAEGKEVKLNSEELTPVAVGKIEAYKPDLRHNLFQIFSNPQWAYLLFMAALGLLYFELTHPGAIVPGVVGAIALVISLMNFHMLDVSWGAVLLILLGVAFMFAELFVPSFGALGIGGIISFVIGSLFLFDEKTIGQEVPIAMILGTSIFLGSVMLGITWMAVSATRRGSEKRADEDWVGKSAQIKKFNNKRKKGIAFVDGELWKVKSRDELSEDDDVVIDDVQGLTLVVSKR